MVSRLVLASCFVACGKGEPDGVASDSTVVVLDSSGVTLIANQAPERALVATRLMKVGVVDGDPTLRFHQVRGLAVDSIGGFWVTDADEAVRHYDSSGRFLGKAGSKGSGPGESESQGSVWIGDRSIL